MNVGQADTNELTRPDDKLDDDSCFRINSKLKQRRTSEGVRSVSTARTRGDKRAQVWLEKKWNEQACAEGPVTLLHTS